jgi:4-hydroxy-4-methyl-2-oxoglutarate aldolase
VAVFSYGTTPLGPLRLDPQQTEALESARFGEALVTREDIVLADDDGAIFVPAAQADEILHAARAIADVEREQAQKIRAGKTLRAETAFDAYLAQRADDPAYSFRRHLRAVGGAVEE